MVEPSAGRYPLPTRLAPAYFVSNPSKSDRQTGKARFVVRVRPERRKPHAIFRNYPDIVSDSLASASVYLPPEAPIRVFAIPPSSPRSAKDVWQPYSFRRCR